MGVFIPSDEDFVLDSLPQDVLATMEVRDRALNGLGHAGSAGLEFLVEDALKWLPGQSVRIAFLGGNTALHQAIAGEMSLIQDHCNLTLDFGESTNGAFRQWSEQDTDYSAEIRISFDKAGYFSLVGTDSINPNIGSPNGSVGGSPAQCSMNFAGFDIQRPATWRGTVKHELLHALGFHHAHQNMRGPCENAFRWDDDDGYRPTRDTRGVFVEDFNGRRPGIYTYLSGEPNNWSRNTVDHNLKTEEDPNLIAGSFDRHSIMLYRFPESFYKTVPSACQPAGDGQDLSEEDIRGLQLLYPNQSSEVDGRVQNQNDLLQELEQNSGTGGGLESLQTGSASKALDTLETMRVILQRNLESIGKK